MTISSIAVTTPISSISSRAVVSRVPRPTAHHTSAWQSGPGTFVGELALLDTGARAADAVTVAPTDCWILERPVFQRLREQEPALAIALLAAICDVLVRNQRWSTRELQRLAEW